MYTAPIQPKCEKSAATGQERVAEMMEQAATGLAERALAHGIREGGGGRRKPPAR